MTDLAVIDRLYELGASATIRRARLDHPLFRDYSIGISRLLKRLGDAAEEEIWKSVLAPLKRYRFAVSAAPLPFNDESVSIALVLKATREELTSYDRAHPIAAQHLAKVIEIGEILQGSTANPIMDFILEQFPHGITDGALLLKDSRLIPQTQRILRRHPATRGWAIVTAGQLKREACYRHLFIVGAARWFPDFVITAPRGSDICVIRYAWIRDATPSRRVFDQHGPTDGSQETIDPNADEPDDAVGAEEILPQIDWAAIQRRGLSQAESGFDDVPAKVAVLEGEFGVFFEDDESATVLTLDLDTDEPTERVRRIPVQRLTPGAFVLLRTTGGGDYIRPIADKLLGKAAPYVRNCQREWKALLSREVVQSSLFEVSVRLLDAGSTCANEMNVRNWISVRNIKTHDPRDFAAIMRVVGLQQRTDEYWNAMTAISQAHQKAGQQIRRVLLRRLQEVDLGALECEGRLELSLPGVDAGSLTAFRIIDLAPAGQLVAVAKLNHPFPVGDPDAAHASR
jgi:hypothetical protein